MAEKVSFFCALSLIPPCLLDPSSIPIFIVMFLVQALLPFTTGEPSCTIPQHLQSGLTPDDFTSGIMLVAGEVVPL